VLTSTASLQNIPTTTASTGIPTSTNTTQNTATTSNSQIPSNSGSNSVTSSAPVQISVPLVIPPLPLSMGSEAPIGTGEFLFHSNEKPSWVQLLSSTIKKLGALPSEVNTLRVEEEEQQAEADGPEEFDDSDEDDDDIDDNIDGNKSYHITKKKLMKKILRWNAIPDAGKVTMEIQQMAKLIQKYERHKNGDGVQG